MQNTLARDAYLTGLQGDQSQHQHQHQNPWDLVWRA
jgi:hypothetical protein